MLAGCHLESPKYIQKFINNNSHSLHFKEGVMYLKAQLKFFKAHAHFIWRNIAKLVLDISCKVAKISTSTLQKDLRISTVV